MIYLAENLKKLRRQADVTQEELAGVLGVSPQAVSRWESEATYPDITLLPAIANYFEVSLDELIGMEQIKDDSDLEAIWDEYQSNTSKGLVADNIRLLREAIRRYPNNYELQESLVHELSWEQADGEKERKNKEEALGIAKRILQRCTKPQMRWSITVQMCYLYSDLGRKEEALKLAEDLPSIWETSTSLLGNLYEGDEQFRHCRCTVSSCLELMYWAVYRLADLDYKREELSTSERIAIMEKCLVFYGMVYEKGDYLEYEERLSKIHRYIAAMEVLEGNRDSALGHLEKAAQHAIAYDTLPRDPVHTSYLVSGIKFSRSRNYTATECKLLYDKLQQERFDAVREGKRFVDILERIKEFV